jgi:hypothetical protein
VTITEATDRVKAACDWDSDPALEEADITRVMEDAKRGTVWVASTAYVTGDVVTPTADARTGYVYVCVGGGTSHTTEPDWVSVGSVGDNTVTWSVCGVEWAGNNYPMLWDLSRATRQAWLLKAAIAAKQFDFGSDDQSFKRDQIIKHCQGMAAQYGAGCF